MSGQNSLGRANTAALKAVCVLGAKGTNYPLILLLLPFFSRDMHTSLDHYCAASFGINFLRC